MSLEKVMAYLKEKGYEDRVRFFDVSSATVALAAEALGCEPKLIAKTLAFKKGEDSAVIIVTAGDTKINNGEFKRRFGFKPTMLTAEETLHHTGHKVGGVCPFALNEDLEVYLDESLKRFETVYPAVGTSNSAIALTPDELYELSNASGWVRIGKIIEQ